MSSTPPFLAEFYNTAASILTKVPFTVEMSSKQKSGRSAIQDVVAREYTIHMHKRVCFTKTDERKHDGAIGYPSIALGAGC